MARTTRSKGAATSTSKSTTKSQSSSSTESKYTLAPESTNPPKIFILPKKATSEARVVSLLNPRYNKPTRYLVCPETGIYEFTRIAAPKSTPRSWLIEGSSNAPTAAEAEKKEGDNQEHAQEFGAYITKGADLYIATPVDPLFLVLPALAGGQSSSKSSDKNKKLFLTSDDHFDTIPKESSPHLHEILRWGNVRQTLEARMAAVCDTVDAGDESMYRLSEEKLLRELVHKARRMSKDGLPASMEDKFVVKALEAPVLSVKRQNVVVKVPAESGQESGASTPKVETLESQSSVSSTETNSTAVSDASTAATSVAADEEADAQDKIAAAEEFELKPAMVASAEVVSLQRLRVAFSFILSSYIAPAQSSSLRALLSEKKDIADLTALDEYLAQVAKLRQEAVASRSMTDYSRKRMLDDDELAVRAEKKRKKEEEEKRQKAGTSRGVKNLGKVNTSGMKKMSDFFRKK